VEADDVLIVGRVITLDPGLPEAEAVLVRGERILGVGRLDDLRAESLFRGHIVETHGGLILPAFHDAHLHLLKYARTRAKLDCGTFGSLHDLQIGLRRQAAMLSPGEWLRGWAYDERRLHTPRHPSRWDLDQAVADRPVRLEHRGLHLDLFNTRALDLLGLMDYQAPEVERDDRGQPTGRVYDGARLLRSRLPRPSRREIADAVRGASRQLLAWGVTSVQEASATNDVEQWELWHALAESGDLGVRLFFLPGATEWTSLRESRQPSSRLRLGPVKIMLTDGGTDPHLVRAHVDAAHAAGSGVAIHALNESDLAIALYAFRESRPTPPGVNDRIEHAAVIPDALLADVAEAHVTVVGQPGLVYDRGDMYLADHPPEQHDWLHRSGSVLAAGIPYAVGSDAPVLPPDPLLAVRSLVRRVTRSGSVLGQSERVDRSTALAATIVAPSLAVGVQDLGILRRGAWADLVVLDQALLEQPANATWTAQLCMTSGRIVWSREAD
jgi:predicted amidohydrolase YtcJ